MTTDGGDAEPTRTGTSQGRPQEPDTQSRRYLTDGGDRRDEESVGAPDRDGDADDGEEGAAIAESTVTESGVTVERRVTETEAGPRVIVDLRADEAGTRSVRVVESFGAGIDVRDVRPLEEYREDWAAGPDGLEFRTVLGPGDETRTAYGLRSGEAEALAGDPTVEIDDLGGSDSGSLLDRITGFLGGSDGDESRSATADEAGRADAEATGGDGAATGDDGADASARPGSDGRETASTSATARTADGSEGTEGDSDTHTDADAEAAADGRDVGTPATSGTDPDATDAEGDEEAAAAAGTATGAESGVAASEGSDAEATTDTDPDGDAGADDPGPRGAGGLVLPEALVGADTIGEALVRELEGGRIDPEVVGRLLAATGGEAEVASWDRVDELETETDRLAGRTEALDDRLADVDGRVEGLDERLAAFDEATPSRTDHEALADRVANLEADADATDDRVGGLADRLDEADDRLAEVDDRLATLEEDLTALRADVDDAAAAADLRSLRADVRAVRADVRDLDGFRGRVEQLINIPEASADDDGPNPGPGGDGDGGQEDDDVGDGAA